MNTRRQIIKRLGLVSVDDTRRSLNHVGLDGPVIADLTAAIHQTASTQQALCQRQTSQM